MHKDSKKVIVTMRHGERADFAGLKPRFGKYDPELTKKGEEQAFKAGTMLSEQLKRIGVDVKTAKVTVYSSPFLRTMQTGRGMIKGFNSMNSKNATPQVLNINYLLCEHIDFEFNGNFPKAFLNSLKQGSEFKEELKDFKLIDYNSPDLLPEKEEDHAMLSKRMANCIKLKLNEVHKSNGGNESSASEVVIMISHGSPLSDLNKELGYDGPYGYQHVNYCQMYFYSIEKDNKTQYISTIYP